MCYSYIDGRCTIAHCLRSLSSSVCVFIVYINVARSQSSHRASSNTYKKSLTYKSADRQFHTLQVRRYK